MNIRGLAAVAAVAMTLVVPTHVALARDARCDRQRNTNHIEGTAGNDVLYGTPERDVIHTGGGDDTVFALGGNDAICTGAGADVIHAGEGGDLVIGGGGPDTIDGGAGEDEFLPGGGDDDLDGGAEEDRLSLTNASDPVQVDLEAGTATGQGNDTLVDVEDVDGAPNGSSITGDAIENEITVNGPADSVNGGGGSDMIGAYDSTSPDELNGGPGDDFIEAWATGADTITGGFGDDFLFGSSGADAFDGGEGEDFIYASGNGLTVDGGSDPDFLQVASGETTIDLTAGTISGDNSGTITNVEHLRGNGSKDSFSGDVSPNELHGFGNGDLLVGLGGNDELDASSGNDELRGNGGDDYLDAGQGDDVVDGGAGWDGCRDGEDQTGCEETSMTDSNDVRGVLDIRVAESNLVERDGVRELELVATFYQQFSPRDVGNIAFLLTSPNMTGRLAKVHPVPGEGLRASLYSLNGRPLGELDLIRTSARIRVTLPVSSLSDDFTVDYNWDAWANTKDCHCRDTTRLATGSLTP